MAETFSRTPNGCGHRQVAMCLRAELGARIADKTVLKMMREMGVRCGIRRETDCHRYNSYRGVACETFGNAIGRDFPAAAPRRKAGAGVTEFERPRGEACLAPVHDFGGKEMVAWPASAGPDMAQRLAPLDRLLAKMPEGATPDRQRLPGRSGEERPPIVCEMWRPIFPSPERPSLWHY